jgi:predicted transglutaminase-like cysteine proteinase
MYPSITDLSDVLRNIERYPYATDLEVFGTPEWWQRISIAKRGDCDDYATEALFQLLELHWPLPILRLGVVRCETGERHLVLDVNLAEPEKEYIIDSRFQQVQTLDSLRRVGYTPILIQEKGGSIICREWKW